MPDSVKVYVVIAICGMLGWLLPLNALVAVSVLVSLPCLFLAVKLWSSRTGGPVLPLGVLLAVNSSIWGAHYLLT